MALNKNELLSYLKKNGKIASKLNRYEERAEQLEMLATIIDAYNDHKFALIEAGTGVGKSLAYLLPAIMQGIENHKTTIISTHTITLQEQLMEKDIPFLLDILGKEIEVVLVKGMNNYLCLRKLEDQMQNIHQLQEEEKRELLNINEWSQNTTDGSTADLEKKPREMRWEKLSCESDACNHIKCPMYKNCFFFQARKKVKDANLLIVNHHLLLADLQTRESDPTQSSIFGEYHHLILDEAHTFEDVATNALAKYTSASMLLRKLSELISDNNSLGKLQQLKQKLLPFFEEIESKLWQKIDLDLFAEKRNLQSMIIKSFSEFETFVNNLSSHSYQSNHSVEKVQITPEHRQSEEWALMQQVFKECTEEIRRFIQSLESLDILMNESDLTFLLKKTQSVRLDIESICNALNKSAVFLDTFFANEIDKDQVLSVEIDKSRHFLNIQLYMIHLDVSEILAEKLFGNLSSCILCSATLSFEKQFLFIKKQLGLNSNLLSETSFLEKILPSPFNYQKQVLFAIPTHLSPPNSPSYLSEITTEILNATLHSKGGAFILFTSYKTLEYCYHHLVDKMLSYGLNPLKQGDESRGTLLTKFKKDSSSVLFGTDTFWEGIDVPGFHLRLVILTKLPFPVPSEPIFKARCELIEKRGQNPFYHYSIPKAIVKFKQGFGRLIRNDQDYGCILCLDSRVITKNYGRYFIDSLPQCRQAKAECSSLQEEIARFFKEKSSEETGA